MKIEFILTISLIFFSSIKCQAVSSAKYNGSNILINKTDCLIMYMRGIQLKFNKTILNIDTKPKTDISCSNQTGADVKMNFVLSSKTVVDIQMRFTKTKLHWSLNSMNLSVQCSSKNCTNIKNVPIVVKNVMANLDMSYHCFSQIWKTVNMSSFALVFTKLQMQPFIKGNKFGAPNDCIGFFSEGSTAVLFVSIILISILSFALYMIMQIQTGDKFEDPKGKSISIGGSE